MCRAALLDRQMIIEIASEKYSRDDQGRQHRRLVQGDAPAADGEVAENEQHPSGAVQRGIQQGKVDRSPPRGELSHCFTQLAEVFFKNLLTGGTSVSRRQPPEVAADVALAVDEDEMGGVIEFIAGLALARRFLPDTDLEALDQETVNVLLL